MICHCKFIQPQTSHRKTSNPINPLTGNAHHAPSSSFSPSPQTHVITTLLTHSVPDKSSIHVADNGVDPMRPKLQVVLVSVKF